MFSRAPAGIGLGFVRIVLRVVDQSWIISHRASFCGIFLSIACQEWSPEMLCCASSGKSHIDNIVPFENTTPNDQN